MDDKQKERLVLAEQWLELAEHSSEIEMRNSLSRMYYAVYHVAVVLTGESDHTEIQRDLEKLSTGLGGPYRSLRERRSWADYTPGFGKRKSYKDLIDLSSQFAKNMQDARDLYERLLILTGDHDEG